MKRSLTWFAFVLCFSGIAVAGPSDPTVDASPDLGLVAAAAKKKPFFACSGEGGDMVMVAAAGGGLSGAYFYQGEMAQIAGWYSRGPIYTGFDVTYDASSSHCSWHFEGAYYPERRVIEGNWWEVDTQGCGHSGAMLIFPGRC